ncbi:MAG: YdcF family protein [Anaerolineales bacterium]|nr:YdcF family protein [Anaerolineales bacterium]
MLNRIKNPRFLGALVVLGLCVILAGLPLVRLDKLVKADAIVMIGGDHKPERVQRVVELYQQGYASTVIISAGTVVSEGHEQLAEAEVMRRQALVFGLPESAIIIENQSRSTFQNAYFTKAILQERGYNSIILVTSLFHSRRAGQIFREVFGATPIISIQPAEACELCWWFQPDQVGVVFYEYYNWARYWLNIRLPNEAPPNR